MQTVAEFLLPIVVAFALVVGIVESAAAAGAVGIPRCLRSRGSRLRPPFPRICRKCFFLAQVLRLIAKDVSVATPADSGDRSLALSDVKGVLNTVLQKRQALALVATSSTLRPEAQALYAWMRAITGPMVRAATFVTRARCGRDVHRDTCRCAWGRRHSSASFLSAKPSWCSTPLRR